MNPILIHTFGCKVNTYDSGLLQGKLSASGDLNAPKIHVLNTCAVTREATKEAVKLVKKLKREDPDCRVVVTGCSAQVDTEFFDHADLVIANSHKGEINQILHGYLEGRSEQKVYKSNIFKKEDLEAGGGVELDHTRSFLKIQDGCNSFCSFCVIPFARGKSRSIGVNALVKRVQELYDSGVRETVLTGVHIGDYQDGDLRLEDLVENLLQKTKMPRFRLSSLEPIEVSPRLIDLYSDEKLCPHFHMSIQSANTKVLSDMKRKYTQKEVEQSLKLISEKVKGSFVGMDVIVGFPGETNEEFKDTFDKLSELSWTKIHVFPYSQRPLTRANRMEDQLPLEIIRERSRALRELSLERHQKTAIGELGKIKKVLPFKRGSDGLSRDYWPVYFTKPVVSKEEIYVEVTGYDTFHEKTWSGHLIGRALD